MATKTSVGSGPWSVAGTWDLGVPANTDTVIIAAGHVVTFDVDQTAFASGVDLTITGTLVCSTTAGAYVLKCSTSIDGVGSLLAGTSTTPLPANVTFTISCNGGNFQIGPTTVALYCTPIITKYVRLTAQEVIGSTVLNVDTDVTKGRIFSVNAVPTAPGVGYAANDLLTVSEGIGGIVKVLTVDGGGGVLTIEINVKGTSGYSVAAGKATTGGSGDGNCTIEITAIEGHWADGDLVNISEYKVQNEQENKTIAVGGVASGTITVTVGLVVQKEIGSYICNLSRNIKIISGTSNCFTASKTGYIVNAEIRGSGAANQAVFNSHTNFTSTNSSFYMFYYIAVTCLNPNISDFVICACSGNGTSQFSYNILGKYSNFIISGTATTNIRASLIENSCNYKSGIINSLVAAGKNTAVNFIDCTFSNIADLDRVSNTKLFNCAMNGTSEHINYTLSPYLYSESFDHDQSVGVFRAWSSGGTIDSNTGTVPVGRTKCYSLTCETVTYPVIHQDLITVCPGEVIRYRCFLRKTVAMAILPFIAIIAVDSDPLYDSTESALGTFTMTDSTDTWESAILKWTNTGTLPRQIYLRAQGQNASGVVYSLYERIRNPASINKSGSYID